MYTPADARKLSSQAGAKLFAMIIAKTYIQNSVNSEITEEEKLALMMDTLPSSLVEKEKEAGKEYLRGFVGTDLDVYCVAMAVGTIIKELDNGNTEHVSEQSIVDLMNYLVSSDQITIQGSNPLMKNGKLHVVFEADQGLRRQNSDNSFMLCDNQARTIEIVPNTDGMSSYTVEPGEGYLVTIYDPLTGRQTLGTKPMDIVNHGPDYVELRGMHVMAVTPFGFMDPGNEDYAIRVYYNDREPIGVWFHRYDTGNDYLYSCARFNISGIVKNNNFLLK